MPCARQADLAPCVPIGIFSRLEMETRRMEFLLVRTQPLEPVERFPMPVYKTGKPASRAGMGYLSFEPRSDAVVP